MKLKNKTALITGGGTGIGRACVELFAAEGASVVITGRRSEPLQETAKAIRSKGGRVMEHVCDVRRAKDVAAAVSQALAEFGGLHVVVNNAGYWMAGNAEETSEEEWDQVMDTNLKGAYLVSKAVLPELRRAGGGSIINIGSILSLVGMKRRAAYSASKGGLAMLTRAMALDHAGEGIRINCICPGLVETPLAERALAQFGDPQSELARRVTGIPAGRAGRPEDVARLALYLAGEDSTWMTGAVIPLDGGFTAY